MLPTPRPACLILADISGYTTYLAGAELDHAQDILADLMDTVVGSLRPAFRLAKLEGDAAFVFVETEHVDGSLLQDTIEGCYFAFHRRLRDIRQATTCPCNACVLIPTLDLKLIAHHGLIARQRMAGREELVGRDVIVVHRLLKNSVEASLGIAAYALYTDACLAAMGIDDPASAGLIEHRETYDVIGEVLGWVRDLTEAWRLEQQRARVIVSVEAAGWTIERDFPGPPSLAWAVMTAPEHRLAWQVGITGFDEVPVRGRRGIGTVNHCRHGKDTILEEILDWEPPHHQTIRIAMPIPDVPRFVFSDVLEPAPDGGTHLSMRIGRPRSRADRERLAAVWPMIEGSVQAGLASADALVRAEVARLVEGEAGSQPAAPAAVVVESGGARSS